MTPHVAPPQPDERDENRISLETEVLLNIQLIKDIYPTLTYALSKGGNGGCKPFIRARLAEVGLQLNPLQIPSDISRVSHGLLDRCYKHMCKTLSLLDDALSSSILEHRALPKKREQQDQTPHHKLKTLQDLISFRYRPPSTAISHEEKAGTRLAELANEELYLFVEFSRGFQNERMLVEALTQFTAAMSSMLPQIVKPPHQVLEPEYLPDDEALQIALGARSLCDALDRLLDLVSSNTRNCPLDHSIALYLSNFCTDGGDMRIMLSNCLEANSQAKWYPIHCQSHSASITHPTPNLDLCAHLRKSSQRLRPIKINYDNLRLWESSTAGRTRLDKNDVISSPIQLANFVQTHTTPLLQQASFRRGERRRLQCLLALSLLYLYRNSWFEDIWDLTSINFSGKQPMAQFDKPYAYRPLKSSPTEDNNETSAEGWDSNIFMANFGLLLLQIECQQHLQLSEEELMDEYGIEIALDRYLKELKGDIEDPIVKVLLACLDFDAFVEQIADPSILEDGVKHRIVILKRILMPLKELLALSFPEVSAEIPEVVRGYKDAGNPTSRHFNRDPHPDSTNVRSGSPIAQTSSFEVGDLNDRSSVAQPGPITSVMGNDPTGDSCDHEKSGLADSWEDQLPTSVRHTVYKEDNLVPWVVKGRLGYGRHSLVEMVEALPTNSDQAQWKGCYVRKLVRLPPSRLSRESHLDQLQKEVGIMESLSHTHTVILHATYTLSNEFAIIMSPVGDANLQEYLENNLQPGPNSPIYGWFGCLASTFAYLHSRRIRHRDVKPSNILVKGNRVILTDFGISKDMWDELATSTTGPVDARTRMYCAPEVAMSADRGRPSDIFSLGCVFLEMATSLLWKYRCSVARLHDQITSENGKAYFASLDQVLRWIMTQHLMFSETFPIPSSKDNHSKGIDFRPVLEWCLSMLFPDPNDRISAHDLASTIANTDFDLFQYGPNLWICVSCTRSCATDMRLQCEWPHYTEDDVSTGNSPNWDVMRKAIKLTSPSAEPNPNLIAHHKASLH